MTKPSKQPKESTAAEWNMITAEAEIEKLESEMNLKKAEFKEIRMKRREMSSKILKLKEEFHRLREKLNSMFYHTKTLQEIEEQMDFESIIIPEDDFQLGNISALVSIPMYEDSSPEEDQYVEMSDELFQSTNDMHKYNQQFKNLNEEIENYEKMIVEKETEIKQAAAEQKKAESKPDVMNVAVTIPELIFNQFQDSSPDDQEYNELKIDFVEEVNEFNDKFTVFNEARKKLKTKKPSTQITKKNVYGAPIRTSQLKSIVKSAQKIMNRKSTFLANEAGDEDQYQSFRDEPCNDNCKLDCKCKMQSRIAIK